MLSLEFFAMGCQMHALCQLPPKANDNPQTVENLAIIPAHFAQAERRFSRFLPDSELCQLNQQRELAVSDDFWQLLQQGLASAELTQGLITPTLLEPLLDRGYRQDFSQLMQTHLTPTNTPKPLPNLHAWQEIHLEPKIKQITLPNDISLDFGGFAKGLTAWQSAKNFAQHSSVPVLIDAGGDIVTQGHDGLNDWQHWQNWRIDLPSVADMALPIEHLTAVTVNQATYQEMADWHCVKNGVATNALPLELILPVQQSFMLATSGIDYRFWFDGDGLQHHLIDPTGSPHSDIVCASVLIEDGQDFTHPAIGGFLQHSNRCNLAQTLSKLFCLLGVAKSRDWQKRFELEHIGVSWIVCDGGENPAFQQWLNPVMQGFCQTI